jgi:hypothetical protein
VGKLVLLKMARLLLGESDDDVSPGPGQASGGDPESYRILFDEAVRALSAQKASVDELRTRSGVMLTGAGVVSAFLGSAALTAFSDANTRNATNRTTDPPLLAGGMYAGIVVAIVLTIAASAIFVLILRTKAWSFQSNTQLLLAEYIETEQPASPSEIRRSLAWYMHDAEEQNQATLGRLYKWFNRGAIVFIADLIVWFVVLAVRLMP